jgi:hypothetical protein
MSKNRKAWDIYGFDSDEFDSDFWDDYEQHQKSGRKSLFSDKTKKRAAKWANPDQKKGSASDAHSDTDSKEKKRRRPASAAPHTQTHTSRRHKRSKKKPKPRISAETITRLSKPKPSSRCFDKQRRKNKGPISGKLSDVAECTFKPKIKKKASKVQTDMTDTFMDRLDGYIFNHIQVRHGEKPLGEQCTFTPKLNSFAAGGDTHQPDVFTRMEKYRKQRETVIARLQADEDAKYSYQPDINRGEMYDRMADEDKDFLERYEDDLAVRDAELEIRRAHVQEEMDRELTFRPRVNHVDSGGFDSFLHRVEEDLYKREVKERYRQKIFGGSTSARSKTKRDSSTTYVPTRAQQRRALRVKESHRHKLDRLVHDSVGEDETMFDDEGTGSTYVYDDKLSFNENKQRKKAHDRHARKQRQQLISHAVETREDQSVLGRDVMHSDQSVSMLDTSLDAASTADDTQDVAIALDGLSVRVSDSDLSQSNDRIRTPLVT